MGSVQRVCCSPVATLVHDAVMKVEAASSQHRTAAGHHPVCILLSKDEGASIVHRDALRALRRLPLTPACHLHYQLALECKLRDLQPERKGSEGTRGGGEEESWEGGGVAQGGRVTVPEGGGRGERGGGGEGGLVGEVRGDASEGAG